jgi:hypothetical protein
MPKTRCTICNSSHRAYIEEQALENGVSIREISQAVKDKFGMKISHVSISNHLKNHLNNDHLMDVETDTEPELSIESRLRTLEIWVAKTISNDIAAFWDEVDEQGTQKVSITNPDVFRSCIPNPNRLTADETARRAVLVARVKAERGSVNKTPENVIKRRLEAIHAEEERMRTEETDFAQREIDEQNAKASEQKKLVAKRLSNIDKAFIAR